MYSGKTSELFRRRRRLMITGKRVIVVAFDGDNRYSKRDEAASHNFDFVDAVRRRRLDPADPVFKDVDAICVDEGQFYDGLVEFCETMTSKEFQKTVIVAALSSDFRRQSFESIARLIPTCDRVDMLYSICTLCHCEGAAFSRCIVTATLENTESNVAIGSTESYIAVCRACYTKPHIDTAKLDLQRSALDEIRKSK
jgi:thymidine kinase